MKGAEQNLIRGWKSDLVNFAKAGVVFHDEGVADSQVDPVVHHEVPQKHLL